MWVIFINIVKMLMLLAKPTMDYSCWPLSDSFSSDFKLQLNELVWIKKPTFLFQKHQFSQYKYLLVICSFTPKIKFHFSWYIRSNKFNFAHFKVVRARRWLDVYTRKRNIKKWWYKIGKMYTNTWICSLLNF